MRILHVSAIFISPEEFRRTNLQETTETLIVDGLRARGVDVDTRGHAYIDDWSGYDVVHVSHLANSTVRMFFPQAQKIVFSRHATITPPWHHGVVLRQTYRRADRVVVSSQMEAESIRSIVPDRRIRVIPNGINGANFPMVTRTLPDAGARWNFLYVGQLIELKRVHLAISLIADLVATGTNAHLDIVSQRETLRTELENQARVLGVLDRIHFLGPRNREALGSLMGTSHALVLPSRTEALPTVVTEASFSGLPVLAFNVGGITEQLPRGYPLPDIADYGGMLETARSFIADYAGALATMKEHESVARATFAIDTMVDKHLELYTELRREGR